MSEVLKQLFKVETYHSKQLQFTADRLMESTLRTGTADNDINAIRNMGVIPQGYVVNHYLNDADAFFIKTDAPNGLKHFTRTPLSKQWKVILIQAISDTKQEILIWFLRSTLRIWYFWRIINKFA